MKVTPLALPEVLLVEPRVFGDERGFFYESWNRRAFAEAGNRLPIHARARACGMSINIRTHRVMLARGGRGGFALPLPDARQDPVTRSRSLTRHLSPVASPAWAC